MDDMIYRRAAIDAIKEQIFARIDWLSDSRMERKGLDVALCVIEDLPSAQPEIVRCVDCVHSDTFPKGADNDMPLKCLGIRYGGVMPDWYCEHAERRTDANNNSI